VEGVGPLPQEFHVGSLDPKEREATADGGSRDRAARQPCPLAYGLAETPKRAREVVAGEYIPLAVTRMLFNGSDVPYAGLLLD